jgi:hypothetical protein
MLPVRTPNINTSNAVNEYINSTSSVCYQPVFKLIASIFIDKQFIMNRRYVKRRNVMLGIFFYEHFIINRWYVKSKNMMRGFKAFFYNPEAGFCYQAGFR